MLRSDNELVYVAGATAPIPLQIFGIPVQEWMYIASLTVSLLYIVDKVPVLWAKAKSLWHEYRK